MPDEPQETIETLTEALRGLYEVVAHQGHLVASLIRALDDEGIPIPGVRTALPPTH